eukprot:3645016-Pleurochrysis_carterae.AAC.1
MCARRCCAGTVHARQPQCDWPCHAACSVAATLCHVRLSVGSYLACAHEDAVATSALLARTQPIGRRWTATTHFRASAVAVASYTHQAQIACQARHGVSGCNQLPRRSMSTRPTA